MLSVELGLQVLTASAKCALTDGNRTSRRHRVSRVLLGMLVVREPALHVDQANVPWRTGQRALRAPFKPTARPGKTVFCAALGLSLIWDGPTA